MEEPQAETPEEACTILANDGLRLIHGLLGSAEGRARIPDIIGDVLRRTEPFSNISPEYPVRSRIHSLVQIIRTVQDGIHEIIVTVISDDDYQSRSAHIKAVAQRLVKLITRSVG